MKKSVDSKTTKTVQIILPNGKTFTLTPKELGGFVVGTYDYGMGYEFFDITEATTRKDCKKVGNLFIKVLDTGFCHQMK
jgi:hypothetical protein